MCTSYNLVWPWSDNTYKKSPNVRGSASAKLACSHTVYKSGLPLSVFNSAIQNICQETKQAWHCVNAQSVRYSEDEKKNLSHITNCPRITQIGGAPRVRERPEKRGLRYGEGVSRCKRLFFTMWQGATGASFKSLWTKHLKVLLKWLIFSHWTLAARRRRCHSYRTLNTQEVSDPYGKGKRQPLAKNRNVW